MIMDIPWAMAPQVPAAPIKDTILVFAWPYKFYNTEKLVREYNASHDRDNVSIDMDEENYVFRMVCSLIDADFHGVKFIRFVGRYIDSELGKMTGDIMNEDASQIAKFWSNDKVRLRYYNQALLDTDEEGQEMLIGVKKFESLIPYQTQRKRLVTVNIKIFEDTAENYQSEIKWADNGLQVSSDHSSKLKEAVNRLAQMVELLDGVYQDRYWATFKSTDRFRFLKVVRPADHSMYAMKDFRSTFVDLHLAQYDHRSLQYLTVKATATDAIKQAVNVKNPWEKHTRFRYGSDSNKPQQLFESETATTNNPSQFMQPEQADRIQTWVADINSDTDKPSEHNVSAFNATKAGKNMEGANQPGLRADEQPTIGLDAVREVSTQFAETDIQERLGIDDALKFDRPKKRNLPRLQTASSVTSDDTGSRKTSVDSAKRPEFVDILVLDLAKLVSAIALHRHQECSIVVHIGQLFVAANKVPSIYRPAPDMVPEGFRPMNWSEVFPSSSEIGIKNIVDRTLFARRLTSSENDAFYLPHTTLPSTQRSKKVEKVFESKSCSDTVSYRIRCQNTITGTIALLEIDRYGNVSIKSQPKEIGFVNIHFPESILDARFASTVTATLTSTDRQAFEGLLDSIWIGDPEEHFASDAEEISPVTEEKLYARKPDRITILSCQRRRQRTHRTTEALPDDKLVFLHITKVEELYIASLSSLDSAFCAFSIPTVNPSLGGRKEQRVWWEAHLTSAALDALLPPTSGDTYAQAINPAVKQIFYPAEEDPGMKAALRELVAPLFNAAHSLIYTWDNVGHADRQKGTAIGSSGTTTGIGGQTTVKSTK